MCIDYFAFFNVKPKSSSGTVVVNGFFGDALFLHGGFDVNQESCMFRHELLCIMECPALVKSDEFVNFESEEVTGSGTGSGNGNGGSGNGGSV